MRAECIPACCGIFKLNFSGSDYVDPPHDKKCIKIILTPFFRHFQTSVTGSKIIYKSIMARSN